MTQISIGTVAFAAIFGLCAVLLALGGYLIRGRGMLGLLAGYDPRQVADPEGLARFAGTILYQMAAATLIVPVLITVLSGARVVWLVAPIGYSVVILFMCVRLIIGARRYMK